MCVCVCVCCWRWASGEVSIVGVVQVSVLVWFPFHKEFNPDEMVLVFFYFVMLSKWTFHREIVGAYRLSSHCVGYVMFYRTYRVRFVLRLIWPASL